MLALTTKLRYGILAVLDLAEHRNQGLVQIKEIVKRKQIPKNYLEQIFNRLTKQGVVVSVRGSRGGYALAREPGQLSLVRVMEALDGQIELKRGAQPEALWQLLDEAEHKLRNHLDISLADLLVRQQHCRQAIMYHI
jgi:Rrf2 family iron-sulfur cluster assembly transcriptional regulator